MPLNSGVVILSENQEIRQKERELFELFVYFMYCKGRHNERGPYWMVDRRSPKAVKKKIAATVKFFDEGKGFGFVSPEDGSPDAFVHISVLQDTSYTELAEGMRIVCDLSEGDRGPQVSAIYEPEDGEVAAPVGHDVEIDGVVTTFVEEHKYGFITPDGGGKQVFFHTNMLERSEVDMENFGVDAHVKCVVRPGLKGPIADSLELI